MELKQLYYFKEVCKDKNFTTTSKRLFITQQGLNKSILLLEKELNCELFKRTGKVLTLTNAGKALLSHADTILNNYQTLLDQMQEYNTTPTLRLHMALGTRLILPDNIFDTFLQKYPNIHLDIKEYENTQCLENLENDTTDIVIATPNIIKTNYKSTLLYEEEITFIVSQSHFFAQKEKITLKDLDKQPLVLFSGTNIEMFLEHCRTAGAVPQVVETLPDILSVYQRCDQRHVFGISVKSLKDKLAFSNVIEIPFDKSEIVLNLHLITPKNTGSIQLLTNYLVNEIQNL